MDLSFPKGASLYDHVNKDEFLGDKIELIYPKVHDFIQLIERKGVGCLLYKTDLRRAFRQLSLFSSSYNVCIFVLNKHIFCNCVLPMGAKSSGFLCQRFANAIFFMLFKIEICILNYLDELASAETSQNAHFDLELRITNGIVSSKICDKRDDFNFEIVNFPFLDGDVPRSPSYGVYISQLIRFARVCSNVDDFNNRN